MSLSCGIGDYNPEPTWWYWPPEDYRVMPEHKRRRRCSSCGELIEHGSTVATFWRKRFPKSRVETAIFGDDSEPQVPISPMHHCERCADLYFSLYELGFCGISPDESMLDLAREYAEVWGASQPVTG